MTDLLPCPFCGGEAFVEFGPIYGGMYARVLCLDKAHTNGLLYKSKGDAIAAWNTRADTALNAAYERAAKLRKTFCEASPGIGAEFRLFIEGFDAAIRTMKGE